MSSWRFTRRIREEWVLPGFPKAILQRARIRRKTLPPFRVVTEVSTIFQTNGFHSRKHPFRAVAAFPCGITCLARAYHGVPIEAVWNGKDGFTTPAP
jgi:hypothetical protein